MLRRRWWLAAGLLVALVAGWSARGWLLPPVAGWLDVGVAPRPVDAVLPLPGDEHTRPFVAAAWLRAGLADALLINQNAASPDVEDGVAPPTHEVILRVAEVRDVPPGRIVMLRGASTNTADDLGQLAAYLQDHPEESVAVVTSAFHTRRTRWTIRRRLPEAAERIVVVSAPDPGFDSERWWWNDTGRRLITSEYLKLGFYQLRYGRGWIAVAAVVGLGAVGIATKRHRRTKRGGAESQSDGRG